PDPEASCRGVAFGRLGVQEQGLELFTALGREAPAFTDALSEGASGLPLGRACWFAALRLHQNANHVAPRRQRDGGLERRVVGTDIGLPSRRSRDRLRPPTLGQELECFDDLAEPALQACGGA